MCIETEHTKANDGFECDLLSDSNLAYHFGGLKSNSSTTKNLNSMAL